MIRSLFFGELVNLSDTLDPLSHQRWDGSQLDRTSGPSCGASRSVPLPIDVYSTGGRVVLIAAVPGMQPDDLELTVHQNTVTLRSTIRSAVDAEDSKSVTWHVSELGSGACQRSVILPFPIDADHASVTFEHGLVRVTLPKADSAKPKKIAITSSTEAIAANTT